MAAPSSAPEPAPVTLRRLFISVFPSISFFLSLQLFLSSSSVADGGKNPVFQEKFVFPLIEGLREINVLVWNSNTLTFDDFIGSGKFVFFFSLLRSHLVSSLSSHPSFFLLQDSAAQGSLSRLRRLRLATSDQIWQVTTRTPHSTRLLFSQL